jgi:ABC-type anion transport system duplicated permease subunit
MLAAYLLSLAFTLVYGYLAAYIPPARQILLPLLDVLQSVPILSFMPVVLLGLSALLPASLAAELAAIVLIFTSQVWNLTFAWYQSLTTIGQELREASTIFRFNRWLRLKWLELPSAAIPLIWNSMMSWAGGFFFLMAAERYSVGSRNFQLPGLGSFLQAAASAGDLPMLVVGIAALVLRALCWTSCSGARCWSGQNASKWSWWQQLCRRPPGSTTGCRALRCGEGGVDGQGPATNASTAGWASTWHPWTLPTAPRQGVCRFWPVPGW